MKMIIATMLIGALLMIALPRPEQYDRSAAVLEGLQVLPPHGWVEFCQRAPSECIADTTAPVPFNAEARIEELTEVHLLVQRTIEPMPDPGVDTWSLPTKYGDCEDYALLKRHKLLEMGWPASALLMAVVHDEAGAGHAILMADTQQGVFVLDNKLDDVVPWQETHYVYVVRQAHADPMRWEIAVCRGCKP
jgi:predicted transglutaminase-like cysteine proteinase